MADILIVEKIKAFYPSQVAQFIGASPIHHRVVASIPSIPGQGTHLGAGFIIWEATNQ